MPDNPVLSTRDNGVLKALADHGEMNPGRARHTLLYFYPINDMAPEDERRAITRAGAPLAERDGWRISLQNAEVLILETEADVTPATIAPRSAWAEAMAEEIGLHFDGWECMVLADPPDED